MSRAYPDAVGIAPGRWKPSLRGWFERERPWLRRYRPRVEDWRFWAVQGLVLAVAGVHDTIEMLERAPGHENPLSFAPISLFFVPVVYASLNFGFAGSVATALWCVILAVPNV